MSAARKILVTSALPYANGPIHLGHLVEYIQTDIWARFMRTMGHEVTYLCADDAHGAPIMLRAEAEGISPEALVERVGREHQRDFAAFHVAFDHYHSTHSPENQRLAEDIFKRLQEAGHIARYPVTRHYDPEKGMFLADRFIRGTCPRCGAADQYGDSCEQCGATYAPTELQNPESALSGATPVLRESEHYFFRLEHFGDMLREWTRAGHLQSAVSNKIGEWFDAGLQDWDVSRDAPYFGFRIPGSEDQYFYVWLDAPIGYLASLWHWLGLRGEAPADPAGLRPVWAAHEVHHFIGKDILYFHALFWPAMLEGSGYRKPDHVHAHGFLTVNGQKMSKSRGTFIRASAYLEHLEPEYLRYYFAAKLSSDIDDIDLSFDDFRARVNSDLVGKVVNIASRSAGFISKQFDGRLAAALPEPAMFDDFAAAGDSIAAAYEAREYARAMREIMALADRANEYIAARKPWEMAKDDSRRDQVQGVCTQALNLFRVLALYLAPVLPATAGHIEAFLASPLPAWPQRHVPLLDHPIERFKPLLTRIEPESLQALVDASREAA